MRDPFDRVPKKNPKIYFSDGATSSAVWMGDEATVSERKALLKAIAAARKAFWKEYWKD